MLVIRSIKLVATCYQEYKVSVNVGVDMFKRTKGKVLLFYYFFKEFKKKKLNMRKNMEEYYLFI